MSHKKINMDENGVENLEPILEKQIILEVGGTHTDGKILKKYFQGYVED